MDDGQSTLRSAGARDDYDFKSINMVLLRSTARIAFKVLPA
jgi:hypothetical protein